ncbi:MAG: SagB/ThcOx family dehydrogenase [Planctomycetes bacterium]|jgi:SagB-type dehydrogenase family enzyme|nr:SagB/ThcOx family dehydrogenase [Planctomycetota bacterium]
MSLAQDYHEKTKYAPKSLGQGHEVDWEHPPLQFKHYAGAPAVNLLPYHPLEAQRQTGKATEALGKLADQSSPLSLPNLSRLLYFTNGITAIARGEDGEHFFRAAPSAGALYPTELYLAVRDHPDLADGVYNYNARTHALVEIMPRGFGPSGEELFRKLSSACLNHKALRECKMALIATAVYWRSAWRYGPRAFRRCMLDTGHVLGNFDALAPQFGLCTFAVGGCVDEEVAELLDIDHRKEGIVGVFPLLAKAAYESARGGVSALASSPLTLESRAGEDLLSSINESTCINRADLAAIRSAAGVDAGADFKVGEKYEFSGGLKLAPSGMDLSADLELTILRRRSTRHLSGEGLNLRELSDLLAFAYRPDLLAGEDAQPRYFDSGLLETFLVVRDVTGVAPGVYYFAPRHMELRPIKQGIFREEVFHIALGQELARDAACVMIHTADLVAAVARYGNRAYRYLHLDAGHIGQRVNLGAIRSRLGVSGIGGFFDNEVNALLGIPERELCVYITCLGKPG